MKKQSCFKFLKQLSITVFTSCMLFPLAYADLTPSILAGIESGDRTIRAEVTSLKTIPVPEPSNLYDFVQNKQKAIELGKALFWDMKVGSDSVQACASCHFNAGADSRTKNQFSPGLLESNQDASPNPDNTFAAGMGPNFHLGASDFPTHLKADPVLFNSEVLRDTNDVVSSQGIHFSQKQPAPAISEYKIESTPYEWIDATSGTFYAMTDYDLRTVPLGFELNFYGDTASEVTFTSDGYLKFMGNTISTYSDDFDPGWVRGAYYLSEGTAPNRRFTVTWFELFHADSDSFPNSSPATFQVTLYEGTNEIIYRYQDVDLGTSSLSFGASATVGVKFKDGSLETQYSLNQPVIQNNTALRVYALPTPPTPVASQVDPDGFQVGGINTRRVEPRNTPTVINAAFNHRQFWDGRASNIFNGVNPFGDNDPYAFVYRTDAFENMVPVNVSIDHASLASQAVGPPVSSLEMSTDGRTWREIGKEFLGPGAELPRETCRRMVGLRPLSGQLVHPQDSVLGHLSAYPNPGLNVQSYETMIKQAFKSVWWWSDSLVRINADGSRSIVYPYGLSSTENTFSQMEMNFSLFFGIAVQLYEATLIADDSPVDRFLDGDQNALTQQQLVGFHLADDEGRCINCHGRGEFTYAAVSRVDIRGLTRIRRGDLIDEGFNNIGVRPTLEDLGVGGVDPMGKPLSFARDTHLTGTNYNKINPIDDQLASHMGADGAFKIPTLRNVELTAPYFHNGGESTLEDVIDFYFRGGNFRRFQANPDLKNHPHPVIGFDATRTNESEITGLGILRGELATSGPGVGDPSKGLDDADRASLVAFLKALTDERVRLHKAPFDHPQLFVPIGHPGDQFTVDDDGTGNATDNLMEIPAVGANGGPAQPTFKDNLAN